MKRKIFVSLLIISIFSALVSGVVISILITRWQILTAFNCLILSISIILILISIIANKLTKDIVTPINNLDFKNPLSSDIYSELSLLISRIAHQNKFIKSQLNNLKMRQSEFTAITTNMNEGLIILDEKSMIISINKSASSIFEVQDDAFINKHILTINRSSALLNVIKIAANGVSNEDTLTINENYFELIANPIIVSKKVLGIVLLILNVTEKKKSEQMRREFFSNVSHELKTPLTSISGYAEILKDGLVSQSEVPDFSSRIYFEASRLITLVEDIINLSHIDEKNLGTKYDPSENIEVDLLKLCERVLERLSLQAKQKGITFFISGENAVIKGSEKILDEMIYNLCSNAIKYNKTNGEVAVKVQNLNSEVVLSVSDTGVGIAKEHHSRVFERFYRVDKSHSKETGGTGLGLSIVKHGAIYHNAKVELSSDLGIGTTIRIIFKSIIQSN